jgi:hypothetical protein
MKPVRGDASTRTTPVAKLTCDLPVTSSTVMVRRSGLLHSIGVLATFRFAGLRQFDLETKMFRFNIKGRYYVNIEARLLDTSARHNQFETMI